jgi:hypothetical protein
MQNERKLKDTEYIKRTQHQASRERTQRGPSHNNMNRERLASNNVKYEYAYEELSDFYETLYPCKHFSISLLESSWIQVDVLQNTFSILIESHISETRRFDYIL